MAKIHSKKAFMEKLRFYTSFSLSDEESASILTDYEEWFQNESQRGLGEEDICAALESPKQIVRSLRAESSHPIRAPFFPPNSFIRVLLFMVIHLLAALFFLRLCSRNGLNFSYFAMGLNFCYPLAGMFLLKKSNVHRGYPYPIHLAIGALVLLLLLLEGFLLPKLSSPHAGEICAFCAVAFSLILLGAMLYFSIKVLPQNRQWGFLLLFHLSSILTMLFFLLNQLRMLYQDPSEISGLICGSIAIYGETIILGVVFYLKRIWAKG